MNVHVRLISGLWMLVGVALAGLATLDLVTEERSRSLVESSLIVLAAALVAVTAGLTFRRPGLLGRILVRFISIAALLYAAAWLFLGGVEDASGYWPSILFGVALAVYTLLVAKGSPSAA